MTAAEKLHQKGLQEGLHRGRQEGLQEGLHKGHHKGLQEGLHKGHRAAEIQLLARMLVLRFGALTAADRARLDDSTEDERSAWFERGLTAADLAAVFAAPNGPAPR